MVLLDIYINCVDQRHTVSWITAQGHIRPEYLSVPRCILVFLFSLPLPPITMLCHSDKTPPWTGALPGSASIEGETEEHLSHFELKFCQHFCPRLHCSRYVRQYCYQIRCYPLCGVFQLLIRRNY